MSATLDREPPQTPEPAAMTGGVPPEAPARPCVTCAAPLAPDQDWCLECGAAQPGRIGGRPGWRGAVAVLAMTTLLAGGAVAAAYAALSTEARRQAAAPTPPAAPQIAQPPVQPPARTAPADETPTVQAPDRDDADAPSDEAPARDGADAGAEPAAPPADAGADPGGDPGVGTRTAGEEEVEPEAIDLSADAAATYDPYGRGAGEVTDPGDAVDGRSTTAWQAPVGDDGRVRIGLAISLEEARTLSRIGFDVDTPGFTVELYGTRSSEVPPDILDDRWEHIADKRDVGVRQEFELDGRYRHLVLWVTAMPADTIVRIPEVQVFG